MIHNKIQFPYKIYMWQTKQPWNSVKTLLRLNIGWSKFQMGKCTRLPTMNTAPPISQLGKKEWLSVSNSNSIELDRIGLALDSASGSSIAILYKCIDTYVCVYYSYSISLMEKQKSHSTLLSYIIMCTQISVIDILRIFGFQIGEMMAVVDVVGVVGFFVQMMVATVLVVVNIWRFD